MQRNEHIASLGHRLESTSDVSLVRPLLAACQLEPLEDTSGQGHTQSEYIMATTLAGGIAACVGWTRCSSEAVVIHSLAVAPPSRGSGVGASLLASALAYVMDGSPVEAIYLATSQAKRFFALFGFVSIEAGELPEEVASHAAFAGDSSRRTIMVRHYLLTPRGLDQCAFRLLSNEQTQGVLPTGAVIFFKQAGQMVEASYRGGAVLRGHILGSVEQDAIGYRWHAYTDRDKVVFGAGDLVITSLEDGRRELREPGATSGLLMREV